MPNGWIRPITPRVLVESLRIIKSTKSANVIRLSSLLSVEARRASEICTQLASMGLLRQFGADQVIITEEGIRFFDCVIKDDKDRLHYQLLQYEPYKNVCSTLEKQDLTLDEIVSRSGLNQVATETILRLIEWVGKLQRSNDGHCYITMKQAGTLDAFLRDVDSTLDELTRFGPGIKREFIRIPEVRDILCRHLHLPFADFDRLLSETVSKWPNRFELSSAPTRVAGERVEGGFRLHNRQYFYIRRLRGEVTQ